MIDANSNNVNLDKETLAQQKILKLEKAIEANNFDIIKLGQEQDIIAANLNHQADSFSEQIEGLRKEMGAPKGGKLSSFLRSIGL